MQEVRKSIHNSAALNISKAQAKQAKNYDLKHRGTVLSVSDKIMQFNAQAAQSGMSSYVG